jgi:simple sugar transport system ATP-binding protein
VVRLSDRIVVLKDHRKIAEFDAGPDVTSESIVAAIAEEGVTEVPLETVLNTMPKEASR